MAQEFLGFIRGLWWKGICIRENYSAVVDEKEEIRGSGQWTAEKGGGGSGCIETGEKKKTDGEWSE